MPEIPASRWRGCRLSGMYEFVVNDAPEQAEDAGPAEPVSAGKCSTVS
ncbi:phage tail protein [Escherichia coli]|nr:phage tail protein [Escherichia coli]EFL6451700.1 phage tail protein [Escherichia coli]EFN9801417.1 phage tail protein [Escherichia coli]EFP2224296.1 phage tail protein [Escherichia coli]